MRNRILLCSILLLFLAVLPLGAESFWTHSVMLSIKLQGGGYPTGEDNLSVPNEAHDDMYSWRQEGLFFMVWMSDVATGAVSDTFFPGDADYGFTYVGIPDFDAGALVFSFDNFKVVGRTNHLEFDYDDTLHVKMFHVNAISDTFEWEIDTVLTEPPGDGALEIDVVMISDVVPESPTIAYPGSNIRTVGNPDSLKWDIPYDDDGDELHFKVELSSSESFASPEYVYESNLDASPFSPALPIASGSGQCKIDIPDALESGTWYWRVSSYDGTYYSSPSETRNFTINSPPGTATPFYPVDATEYTEVPASVNWLPPADLDGDSIWFELAIDSDADFSTSEYLYQSWVDEAGFAPGAAVLPESDTCEYTFSHALDIQGQWYYRIIAYDGYEFGAASDIMSFIINVEPEEPVLSSPVDNIMAHVLPDEFIFDKPIDGDSDDLHFQIEFSSDSTFATVDYSYASTENPSVFSPAMPAGAAVEDISFTPPVDMEILTGRWFWRVKAYDGLEYSDYSSIWAFELNSAPNAPVLSTPAIDAELVSAPIEFSWSIPADADSDDLYFRIEVDSDGDFGTVDYTYESWIDGSSFSPEQPVTHDSGNCTFTVPIDMELTEGHWYWRVNAYDGIDFSGATSARHFSINTLPTVPTLVSPIDLSVTAEAPATLQWNVPVDDDGDALHFKVQISQDSDFITIDHTYTSWLDETGFSPDLPVASGTGTAELTHGLDLLPGTYHWRVYAYDGSELSHSSSSWSFTVDEAPDSPTLASPEADELFSAPPTQFQWSIPDDADDDDLHFILEIDSDGDFISSLDYSYDSRIEASLFSPAMPVESGSGSCTFSCPDDLILDTGHWYWRVKAWDGYKFSEYSDAEHFAINAFPSNPVLVGPIDGERMANMPDRLTWDIPEDDDSDRLYFRVQIDSDGDFATSVDHEILSWVDGTSFSPVQPVASGSGTCDFFLEDITLADGTWHWRVSAYDGTDHSAYSSTETFRINNAPEPPVTISPSADDWLSSKPVKLKWETPNDLDDDSVGFIVELHSDSDFREGADYTFTSRDNPELFNPSPNMAPEGGICDLVLPGDLVMGEGHWFWRVKAADEFEAGNPSTAIHFAIDESPAVSIIEYPADGATYGTLDPIEIYGRASYTIAPVDSILISFDGGSTWDEIAVTPGTRHEAWSYTWTPPGDAVYTILTKAVCAAEGVRESEIEPGRNEITVEVNSAAEGAIIDLSPAVLIYDFDRGTGGGFERARESAYRYEVSHDIEMNAGHIIVDLYYPMPNFYQSQEGYWTPEINGLDNFAHPGEPLLPYDAVRVLLPQDKKINTVSIIDYDKSTVPGEFVLDYGKTPYPNSYTGHIDKDQPDQNIYSSDEQYPRTAIKNYDTQISRGYSIGNISLNPVVWTPESKTVEYFEHIRVRLDLANIETEQKSICRGLETDRLRVMKKVENPGFANTYTEDHIKSSSIMACAPESSFTYVIIGPEDFQEEFAPLVEWKKLRGLPSKFVSLETILAEYSGVDSQERIRAFIIDAYSNWETEFVLLGGDEEFIPHRGFVGNVYLMYNEYDIPSDMYYGCLDGNFNYDGDSYWGELDDGPSGADIDWESEVAIGRLPADNETQVANFVNKIRHYEGNPFDGYKETAAFVGEHLWDNVCDDYGSYSLDLIVPYLPDEISNDYYYESTGPWTSADIITRLNSGTHFVNHLGHSNYLSVMKLGSSDVEGLINHDLFLAYSQGCYTAAYDDLTSGLGGAIGEYFVTDDKGAFAYIGNSRYGWGYPCNYNGPSNKFHLKFTDAIYGGDVRHLGDALNYSRETNVALLGFYGAHRWVAQELNLLGDPETPFQSPGGSKIITVRNSGDTTLTVKDIKGRNSVITAFPGQFVLEPGEQREVFVTIVSGVFEEGLWADSLIFQSNDPDNPEAYMPIQINIFGAPYETGKIPPVATLLNISDHSIARGSGDTEISFEGDGADPDGYITGFNWLGALPETLDTYESASTYTSAFRTTEQNFTIDADSMETGMYNIMFTIRDNNGNWSIPMVDSFKIEEMTAVMDIDTKPEKYAITDIYPNPFNSSVTIEYNISEIQKVELSVYSSDGRHVRTIVNEIEAPGKHSVVWNAPQNVPSGTYLIRLTSKGEVLSQKVALIK
ncbi:MAG: C25 family cysteine peptidase [Candidatus Zixiibacteriota bacterium]